MGYTLIEILVVIAIIGILAATALASFQHAQVRAKVARAEADMSSITTALESYAVDHNDYPPNDGKYNVTPIQLSTPVKYLTNCGIIDPFAAKLKHLLWKDDAKKYTYARIVTEIPFDSVLQAENIDHPTCNPGARKKYGHWYQLSIGPDLLWSGVNEGLGTWPTFLFDVPYDPTNGTTSFGNIIRTQKESIVRKNLTE